MVKNSGGNEMLKITFIVLGLIVLAVIGFFYFVAFIAKDLEEKKTERFFQLNRR